MDIKDTIKRLQAPFPASAIKWRIGRKQGNQGQALPYIDARDVQDRLDDVIGPQGWEVTMKPSSVGIIAGIRILLDGQWVLKEDGAQFDNFRAGDVESNAKELAIKGAFSDALKRAAVMWGIARYLYAYKAPFVDIDENGNFTPPVLPAEMLPEGDTSASAVVSEPAVKEAANDAGKQSKPQADKPATDKPAADKPQATPAKTQATTTEGAKKDETADKPTPTVQETSKPEATQDDERRARIDQLADQAAAQDGGSAAASAAPEATATSAAAQEPAGDGAADPYDFSHLELTAEQAANVREMLEKVKKLPPAVLETFLKGKSAQTKLTDAGAAWLLSLVRARVEREKQAA
ncbi:Single-stranded DNA-binding protein DdrA [compost metagenome]